ncbi:MAG: hypothetical protein ACO394_14520 [Blastocatellia bacterium]
MNQERIMKKKALGTALVGLAYLLHQDFWQWNVSQPVVWGIFPIGLFYHIVYTIAVAGLMGLLVRYAWPSHLEPSLAVPDAADDDNGKKREEA